METQATYRTESHRRLADLLDDESGVIMRVRLTNGIGVAYAGTDEAGLLTFSRPVAAGPVLEGEADAVCKMFQETAVDAQRPVLRMKFLSREVVENRNGRFNVVRYAVYFGVQGRLV